MTPKRIHHLNFVVRDLDEAMDRFERMLDVERFQATVGLVGPTRCGLLFPQFIDCPPQMQPQSSSHP